MTNKEYKQLIKKNQSDEGHTDYIGYFNSRLSVI